MDIGPHIEVVEVELTPEDTPPPARDREEGSPKKRPGRIPDDGG